MMLTCIVLEVDGSVTKRIFEYSDSTGKKVYCTVTLTYTDDETVELYFETAPKHRQRGYATKAAQMIVSWALRDKPKKLIINNPQCQIEIDKIASRACFERESNSRWIKNVDD